MSRYISRTASEDISDKASSFADGVEKGQIIYNDHVPQLDTITEQDEHGHVGLAAYEQSKKMAAIVRKTDCVVINAHLICCCADARTEQAASPTNRLVLASTLPGNPDVAVFG